MTYNEWLEHEIKQLERDKRYWLDNFKRVRDDKMNLIDENTQLKKEIDDFYYEQSKLKESDFYIKALKQQLFNAYLKEQHQELLIKDLKLALSSYDNFVDETFPD